MNDRILDGNSVTIWYGCAIVSRLKMISLVPRPHTHPTEEHSLKNLDIIITLAEVGASLLGTCNTMHSCIDGRHCIV